MEHQHDDIPGVTDDPIIRRLYRGAAHTLHEAEEQYLDAAIPDIPGLRAAKPLTHVQALELDRLPRHLIVLGGGYVGLEFAQALLRVELSTGRRDVRATTFANRGGQVTPMENGLKVLDPTARARTKTGPRKWVEEDQIHL